jgi:hypothetical protein
MAKQTDAESKPRVFIASSGAGLETARKIQNKLIDAAEPTVWNTEDWQGKGTLEHLMDILNKYQFGVFVLRPDDDATIKGDLKKITRDNVLLELGLFVGRLGREKSFIVSEKDDQLRIASDLLGINFGLFKADSDSELEVACNNIRNKIREIWSEEKNKFTATIDVNPLTYEAGMLYRILNAASSPHYKPIDYSHLMKPYTPVGEQSLARIAEVRVVAERLFYYYMLADLKAAKNLSQRLRVYFAYYLGDGVPFSQGAEPFYCLGREDSGRLFKGQFVIGISTSEGSDEPKWNSGLPLGGYTEGLFGRALSNAAAAFREIQPLPIDDTDNPPREYRHFNFKVEDEQAVYSVPVLLSEIKTGEESVAPIGVLSISGSHANMISDNIKKRADHLAILLGFIFYLHAKQNRDVPLVHEDVGVTKIPIGFNERTNKDFLRRAVSLRREVAKHFEEYFIGQNIHRLEGSELLYVQS